MVVVVVLMIRLCAVLYCYCIVIKHYYFICINNKPYKKSLNPSIHHHEKYNCIICLASEFSCPALALVIHSLNSVQSRFQTDLDFQVKYQENILRTLSGSPKMWLKTWEMTTMARLQLSLLPDLPLVLMRPLSVLKALCVDFLYDSLNPPSNPV